MRSLTPSEIEKFASVKGVKRIAVENFLSSIDNDIGVMGNTMNAQMDARMYKWNTVTIRTIEAGIRAAGKPKVVGKFGASAKKVAASHEKAKYELRNMANEHNNKVLGIGTKKVIDGDKYTKYNIYDSRSHTKSVVDLLTDLNKINGYRIISGEYGYELWVR